MIARNEGMTKTYNRFHDRSENAEDIQRLRELHAAMDRAVLEAYGWHDLTARAEPIFLDETNEDEHTYQVPSVLAVRLPRRSLGPPPRPQRRTPR
jgi:hypothetical protein